MSTGHNGTIVHGRRSTNAGYTYRTGMGMMPAAEFVVFHDDFVLPFTTNATTGWAGIIDTGGTNITHLTATVGANGVVAMNSDDASEGSALYGSKAFQLVSGKKFFMECRVRCNDVTDNAFQFGLSDLTGTTNPEDLWTTTAANVVAFGILDGSATVKMLSDLSNSGSTEETGTLAMTIDTWHILAIYYNGGTQLQGFVDGNLAITWAQAFATTVPMDTALAPFVGHLNGNGAGNNTSLVDYVRICSQR